MKNRNAKLLAYIAAWIVMSSIFFLLWNVQIALTVHIVAWILLVLALVMLRHENQAKLQEWLDKRKKV